MADDSTRSLRLSSGSDEKSVPSSSSATAGSTPSPDYLPPGTLVAGMWSIEAKLGAGGMGAVYRARNVAADPPFYAALKLSLPPQDESPADRRARLLRFQREFGAVVQLDHPNIIRMLQFFVWPHPTEGHPCCIMPLVEGDTLAAHLRTHHPPLRVILSDLMRPLADALAYIHQHGLRHRDIKPANIMVEKDGHPLLMDFGIARSEGSATLTSTEVLTTFDFAAPEYLQYMASHARMALIPFEYRPESDLFCLGAAFFVVLTGHLPYQHVASGADSIAYIAHAPAFQEALLSFEPPRPSSLNPAIPPCVDELLLRLMARDPDLRIPSGQELVQAIDQLLEANAGEPLLDTPFVAPTRVRAGSGAVKQVSRSGGIAKTANARPAQPTTPSSVSSAPVAAPSHAASRPHTVPLSLVAPSVQVNPPPQATAGSAVFLPPSVVVAPSAFESPLPPPAPPPKVALSDEEMLPSIIRRTSEELRGKAQPAARRQRTLILLLGGVVVLLLVALVAVLGDPPLSHSTTSKSSLLDKSETRQQPNGSPSSSSPLAALPQAEVAPPAPAGAASPTEPPTPTPPVAAPTGPPPSGPTPGGPSKATGPGPQKPNPDAKAVDELLAREYGGQRPVVGAPAKPKVARPDWLKGDVDEEEKAVPSKALGIPTGTEIHARLMKPLDSRTTGSGPAIARLMKPLVLRGAIALPTSTMLYGTAGASGAARFDIHFSRLRLPDGREVAFKAIAYDSEDAKPGLRPSQRIASSGGATRPGLGENLAKGAANVLLGQIPGSDATGQLAKGAGQTVVNQSGSTSSGGGTGEAILLDAPLDFTVFVEDAF